MKEGTASLLDAYAAALRAYLVRGDEVALERAYQLGRKALADGVGVLEMAALHHEALAALLEHTTGDTPRIVKAGGSFFGESLSPFEMTHRGFHEANAALRRLNERLEEEIKRIAHVLHDEAGQLLASVYIALEDAAREPSPAGSRPLEAVKRLLGLIEEQLRRLSHELRPTILDDLGLGPALEFLADGVSKRAGLAVTTEGSLGERPPPGVEIALYRIVQEALNNVVRHAHARHVSIRLRREDRILCCSVKDDGIGFDSPLVLSRPAGGLGLVGMRDRLEALGGSLQVMSAPGEGTELLVTIPMEPKGCPAESS